MFFITFMMNAQNDKIAAHYIYLCEARYEEDIIKQQEERDALVSAIYRVDEQLKNDLLKEVVQLSDQLFEGEVFKKDKAFASLSDDVILYLIKHADPIPEGYVFHCPNSNNGNGGNWMSSKEEANNPYVGKGGEGCGVSWGKLNKELIKHFK